MRLETQIGTEETTARQRALRFDRILKKVTSDSRTIRKPNFDALHRVDLELLFRETDREFFGGNTIRELERRGCPLQFRVSSRMTRSGGVTTSRVPLDNSGPTEFEIAISSTLLFESFRDGEPISVTGVVCENRLQAMQRIMEHEMIHLIEMLLWNDSSCSAKRFQSIARRIFGHRQSTHQLLTPTDTARTQHNIRAGDWVSFVFEQQQYFGYVNRITRRATVLVPSRRGTKYSDGKRYQKYYVPLSLLSRAS